MSKDTVRIISIVISSISFALIKCAITVNCVAYMLLPKQFLILWKQHRFEDWNGVRQRSVSMIVTKLVMRWDLTTSWFVATSICMLTVLYLTDSWFHGVRVPPRDINFTQGIAMEWEWIKNMIIYKLFSSTHLLFRCKQLMDTFFLIDKSLTPIINGSIFLFEWLGQMNSTSMINL